MNLTYCPIKPVSIPEYLLLAVKRSQCLYFPCQELIFWVLIDAFWPSHLFLLHAISSGKSGHNSLQLFMGLSVGDW